ncbi:hypothetical protein P1A145kb_p113 [Pectobacterium phage DU_PP_I]|nr:hypothetical protein P1A145kb_p113 [Pectobacterium phage DU_PP_I]ATS93830.1 hypothetical protein P12B145kb_p114 [Pectobacterium phage DU_PP_IV]QQG33420.1 hypothetical protein [Pectobacterium phage PcCB7V]
MRVRQHRGSLVESLKTVKQIPATKEALADHINMVMDFPVKFGSGSISLIHQGMDDRIGWDTYLITVSGLGVFGYCDGEVK